VHPSRVAVNRRLFLTGAAAVTGGVLAGCVSDDHSGQGGDGPPPPPFPRTVEHQYGQTRIPARPARIVALGRGDADALLALGITPVAVVDPLGNGPQGIGPWARSKVSGAAPVVLTETDVNQIARLTPDLVVHTRSDNNRASWQQLSKVAPTVSGPARTHPYATTWQDQTTQIAAAVALERDNAGKELVAQTEAAFAQARSANPDFAGRTVTVSTVAGGRYHTYVRLDERVRFMEALNFTNSKTIERTEPETYDPHRYFTYVGRDQPDWLDADLTLVFGTGDGAALRNDPALNSIPSARAGRLLIIDDADLADAVAAGTVLSIPYALERIVPQIRDTLH
jgi:iron complex transport system substrate-binding protein